MLTEGFLCTISVTWYDFVFVDAFILIYVLCIVLLKITYGITWPYPFFDYLDLFWPFKLASIFGALMLGVFGFLVLRGLLHIKETRKWSGDMEDNSLVEETERLNQVTA